MDTKTERVVASMANELRRDAERRGAVPNKRAESHIYEPQPWFYLRGDPPLVPPCAVDGLRVVHDRSMCRPYGLFRVFGADGAEVRRQLSHP
jgi:hypothetical protein